MMKYLLDKQ